MAEKRTLDDGQLSLITRKAIVSLVNGMTALGCLGLWYIDVNATMSTTVQWFTDVPRWMAFFIAMLPSAAEISYMFMPPSIMRANADIAKLQKTTFYAAVAFDIITDAYYIYNGGITINLTGQMGMLAALALGVFFAIVPEWMFVPSATTFFANIDEVVGAIIMIFKNLFQTSQKAVQTKKAD